jgi:broad specificity phosphatase PhoE
MPDRPRPLPPDALAASRPDLLVIVRHGESDRNVAKKDNVYFLDDESRKAVQGVPDWQVPLTEEGWRQSRETGEALRARIGSFDYVYHSGYRRAEDTARGILDAYSDDERASMRVLMNSFIRERDNGYTYDMTTAEADSAFPWLQPFWDTFGPWFGRPPGGESLSEVTSRVDIFLNQLYRDRAGQRVLIVTHGGTLRAFRFLLERWSYEDVRRELPVYRTPNCCVNVYRFNPETGRLHLDQLNLLVDDAGPEG